MSKDSPKNGALIALGFALLIGAVLAGMFGVLQLTGFLLVGGAAPASGPLLVVVALVGAVAATWSLSRGFHNRSKP